MKNITIVETNQSSEDIKKIKPLINDFYFEGGLLTFVVTDKKYNRVKTILETTK